MSLPVLFSMSPSSSLLPVVLYTPHNKVVCISASLGVILTHTEGSESLGEFLG